MHAPRSGARFTVLASALLAALFTLGVVAAVPADAEEFPGATYIGCANPDGELTGLTGVGPGSVQLTGSAAACVPLRVTDRLGIAWYSDGTARGLIANGFAAYGDAISETVQIPVNATRVCLLEDPWTSLGCQSLRVPTFPNGSPGTPLIGAKIAGGFVTDPRHKPGGGGDPGCVDCW